MCCFSDEVETVSDTEIFARAIGPDQLVVYSMRYAAPKELAMVLPIPVRSGAGEEAVRFVSLETCADFFAQLRRGFSLPRDPEEIGLLSSAVDEEVSTLVVHDVGAFEASFVPSPADFGRLDPRFRLPVPIWLQLNHYSDWGFAVFKLKPTALAQVHPMAFVFPRRDRERLFFPTLHLHGRNLDKHALFDHTLYCQPEPHHNWHLHGWEDAPQVASEHMSCEAARELLDLEACAWRTTLSGPLENRDTWLGPGERLPARARA